MKNLSNRQFIVLCILIVIGFIYLGYKIDKVYTENQYQTISIESLESDSYDLKSDIWIIKNDVSLLREGK